MGVVHIFVTLTKNYSFKYINKSMADKIKDKKDDKKKPVKHHSGGMSFGMEIVLFMVALFIIWVLVGQPKSENTDKPFIKGQTTNVTPQ